MVSGTYLNPLLSTSQSSLPPPPAPADLDNMMLLNNASLHAANAQYAVKTNHHDQYYAQNLDTYNGEGCVVVDGQDLHPETVSINGMCLCLA